MFQTMGRGNIFFAYALEEFKVFIVRSDISIETFLIGASTYLSQVAVSSFNIHIINLSMYNL